MAESHGTLVHAKCLKSQAPISSARLGKVISRASLGINTIFKCISRHKHSTAKGQASRGQPPPYQPVSPQPGEAGWSPQWGMLSGSYAQVQLK